ncbi:MAG: hypothetical protein QXY99_03890 [Thermoproteota archaeon]
MSSLKTRLEGIALIILALTTCFTPSLLLSRVIAQGGDYEAFLSRLEEYLWDAMPSESDPVRECEYIVPDGFDASQAERLWRVFASNVSTGCSEQDFRRELGRIYPNGTITLDVNGSLATLNLTGLRVEKPEDGSVRVKIPLESSVPLNYTYFNSTSVKVMYEAWNETLVSLYEVERYTGLYRYVIKNVEKNVVFDIVSRLTVGLFPKEMGVGRIMVAYPAKDWPWFLGNPIIAVPGHYEDVRIRVPEHEENLKVLFPGYDPVFAEGWIVTASVSSTSLTLGETLEVHYEAGYGGVVQPEPLNASLKITVTEGFEPLDSVERILNDTHTSGVFRLRAVKPGLHNITLFLTGNAYLSTWPPSGNASFSILIVGPASPSVNIQVLNVDPSIMKHAGLTLELSNTGGSAARSVSIHVTGVHAEPAGVSVGDIDVGGSRRVELNIRLTRSSTEITVRASYRDDEGNNYFSEAKTWVWTRSIWVPEHFEEIKVVVPEHEETVRVFVPDSKHFTHVRFYELTFSYPGSGLVASMPTFQGHYGGFELVSRLKPTGEKEVNGSSVETVAKVDFILLSIEPYWENLGVYEEKEAAGLLEVDPAALRVNGSLEGYRARLVNQFWRTSGRIVMNATQFAIYNETLSNHIARSSLQGEFILRWRKITNATRLTQPAGEKGFLTLIYRPLTVRGSGPLQTIQVRNYAGFNASYVLRVQQFRHQAYQNYPPVMDVYSSPLVVRSWDYNVTLAGLNTREGYTCLVSLMYGLNLVAQAVFSLDPEPSPFWECFWSEVKARAPWILATSTIIILVGFLTGHGTTAAYAGIAVSVVSTVLYLVGGTLVNWDEIEQCLSAYNFYNSLAESFRKWSFELSNYTPPEPVAGPPGPPEPVFKPFEPKGPLAELYWSYSQYFTGVSTRLLEDTVLDLVVGCGITDFETAMNPNASECERGRATGRIVGAALSFAAFIIATKIASIEAKAANTKTPWSLVKTVKAWATPAIYDLLETVLKSRKTIVFIAKHPVEALSIGKFLLVRGLSTLKDKALETWDTVKNELKELVEKIETGVEKIEGFASRTMERLRDFVTFSDEMHSFAKDIGQEEAVETDYAFDGAGFDIPERAEAFSILNAIKAKSWKAARSIDEWLTKLEPGRLKEVVKSGILSKIIELQGKVLDDVGEAWRLNKNTDDFHKLLKGVETALELGEKRQERIFTLLHGFVETRDEDKVTFFERTLGWMHEAREAVSDKSHRSDLTGATIEFMENILNSKLGGGKMLRITEILDNLLKYRRDEIGPHEEEGATRHGIFYRLRDDLESVILGEKSWLLDDCLGKWNFASKIKGAYVSSCGLVGDDFRGNVPYEMNYLVVNREKCIPVSAAPSGGGKGYTVTIPNDAVEYLRNMEFSESAKYLQGDEGFLIFIKDLPQGAKEIIPVKVKSGSQIALTEWFKKAFGKKAEYSKYFYLDDEGKMRINWNALENDYMLLEIEISKGENEIIRLFAFTEREQEIIRVRVGEIAKEDEFVECMFNWLLRADAYLQGYGASEEVTLKIVKEVYGVMQYESIEELLGAIRGEPERAILWYMGKWWEWKFIQMAHEYGIVIDGYQVQIKETNKYLDIIIKSHPFELKYWDWESWTEEEKAEYVNDLLD